MHIRYIHIYIYIYTYKHTHIHIHIDIYMAAVFRVVEPMCRQKFTRLRLPAGLCHICRSHTACGRRIVDIGGEAVVTWGSHFARVACFLPFFLFSLFFFLFLFCFSSHLSFSPRFTSKTIVTVVLKHDSPGRRVRTHPARRAASLSLLLFPRSPPCLSAMRAQ